ncbi:MAG: acyl-CoA/acyl-ACP dehydrogenase [Chloroflexi bacterium]|nr:acyl-CoA/acyl-ACP dehydrogenase [Chloroflexota bacterium]
MLDDRLTPPYPKTEAQAALIDSLRPLLPGFAERATAHDRAGSFPFENFDALRETGYFAACVPEEYGGGGHGLTDIVLAQNLIARADASTAYAVGMHMMSVGQEAFARGWPAALRQRIFQDVVNDGALINSIASEPEMGSPQGGGRPETTMTPTGDGTWVVSGHKTYATLAPVLSYFLTYVALEDGSGERARVAIHRDLPGVRVEETWDTLGLRATGSDDVYFEDVPLSDAEILVRHAEGQTGRFAEQLATNRPAGGVAWFALLLAAASLGVAEAARDYTAHFARTRTPGGYPEPIGKLPVVRQQMGRIEIDLAAARALLFETAEEWDRGPEEVGPQFGPKVAATKIFAVNQSIEVVDRCMRLVGGQSMQRSEPLERYYRDVRAPLANPPIEVRGLDMIAAAVLDTE